MKASKLVLVWFCVHLLACSSETPNTEPAGVDTDSEEAQVVRRSQDLPLPEVPTKPLDVRTSEPGFMVFLDGHPVRTLTGELALTPCRVQIPLHAVQGLELTVSKLGFEDLRQTIVDSEQTEINFPEAQSTQDIAGSLASLPLLETEIGQPVALLALNSARPELDPYVEPNGLVMWFVGDRSEGRAIYRATRNSIYDFFRTPEIFRATQSGELPASPSIRVGETLIYAIPEKNRILSVSVKDASLDRPEILVVDSRPNRWRESAQILPDGLQLFWTERPDGSEDRQTFTATRESLGVVFGKPEPIALPGQFPCLSADGLRQYVFDGQVLRRARRLKTSERFASPEVIANLSLPNYRHNSNRRLFWVSDNEEWFYYSAAEGMGDLYAVRLFRGPGWGYAPRGESIAGRAMVAETKPMDPGSLPFIPEPMAQKAVVPSAPYPQFRQNFVKLLANRDYDQAKQVLQDALQDPEFEKDREPLEWDRQELTAVTEFWSSLRERLKTLPEGTEFRIRRARLKFVRFADDVLYFKVTKEGNKKLMEIPPSDLVGLLAPALKPEDQNAQRNAALFLYYDAAGDRDQAMARLQIAGDLGSEFQERLAGRVLHNSRRLLADNQLPEAIAGLEKLQAEYPESESANTATTVLTEIYESVKFEPIGPRAWESSEKGTYLAKKDRQPNSYLVSQEIYTNFELRAEWKITEPSGSGGVFFRYAAPGREDPYRKAFKLQLADDRTFQPDPQSTGALHTYEAPTVNASKPQGEWNTLRLRVRNLNVEIWINEKLVLETVAQNDLVPLEGFVAFDGINGGIAYRKILIVKLPPGVQ